jgi:hypothetical protein
MVDTADKEIKAAWLITRMAGEAARLAVTHTGMVLAMTSYRRAHSTELKAVFKVRPDIEERIREYVVVISGKELYCLKYQGPEMLKGDRLSKMRGKELAILRKLPRGSD